MGVGEVWVSREEGTRLRVVCWDDPRFDKVEGVKSAGAVVQIQIFGRGVWCACSPDEACAVGMKLIEMGSAARLAGKGGQKLTTEKTEQTEGVR